MQQSKHLHQPGGLKLVLLAGCGAVAHMTALHAHHDSKPENLSNLAVTVRVHPAWKDELETSFMDNMQTSSGLRCQTHTQVDCSVQEQLSAVCSCMGLRLHVASNQADNAHSRHLCCNLLHPLTPLRCVLPHTQRTHPAVMMAALVPDRTVRHWWGADGPQNSTLLATVTVAALSALMMPTAKALLYSSTRPCTHARAHTHTCSRVLESIMNNDGCRAATARGASPDVTGVYQTHMCVAIAKARHVDV